MAYSRSRTSKLDSEGDNTSINNGNSLSHLLVNLDQSATRKLAIFASDDSSFRPVLKIFEISFHGIPWISLLSLAIFMTHDIHLHTKLINLLSGMNLLLIFYLCLK